jgi:nucleotide-binding universal stress UspA family protein
MPAGGSAFRLVVTDPARQETSMYSDLIIGYDGTAAGRDALAFARRLALATGARPVVLYVRPSVLVPEETSDGSEGIVWDSTVAIVLDEAREILADVPGATFRGMPDTSPARALHHAADDADAALIVLGAAHRTGIGRVVPGTTADAVLHAAPCAVAIAPAGYAEAASHEPFGVVAAAVDGGDETERVARVAAAIARRAQGRLRLINVVEWPYRDGPLYAGGGGAGALRELMGEGADDVLERAAAAAGSGIPVERRPAEGHVAEALAHQSDGADLLVMGSRGYGPLRRIVLGSATSRILAAAAIPVLIVPRRTAEELDDAVVPFGEAALVAPRHVAG